MHHLFCWILETSVINIFRRSSIYYPGSETVTGNGAATTQLLSDSDGEVFCDSMEHLASDEVGRCVPLYIFFFF